MAMATSTLTLNAAFLQEIKEDNEELWRVLREAREVFSRSRVRSVPLRRLCDLLGDLRDLLALHFALEEAFGYFEDPVSVAPRLSSQAEILRAQHAELFLEALSLVELSEKLLHHEAPLAELERLAAGFQSFDEKLRKHESAENELVLQALQEDIGVGD